MVSNKNFIYRKYMEAAVAGLSNGKIFLHLFPDTDLERYTKTEALKIVLQRFAYRMVWFKIDMAKSFYKLSLKEIKLAVKELVEANYHRWLDYKHI